MTEPSDSVILQFIARIFMVPFILVFAFYIFTFGEDGPGGGFQAGAIVATAIALVHLTVGRRWAHRRFNIVVLRTAAFCGVGLFILTGLVGVFTGSQFLDYSALPLNVEGPELRKWGVLIVEAGILLGVLGVLAIIFDYLTEPQNSD
jgi:multicomponent Na+:H+ antiporter subunit B